MRLPGALHSGGHARARRLGSVRIQKSPFRIAARVISATTEGSSTTGGTVVGNDHFAARFRCSGFSRPPTAGWWRWRDRIGDRFAFPYMIDERIAALPICSIWGPERRSPR